MLKRQAPGDLFSSITKKARLPQDSPSLEESTKFFTGSPVTLNSTPLPFSSAAAAINFGVLKGAASADTFNDFVVGCKRRRHEISGQDASFVSAEAYRAEIEAIKNEARARVNQANAELVSVKKDLQEETQKTEKLTRENKILRTALSNRQQNCSCTEMAATVEAQRQKISHLERIALVLQNQVQQMERGINPASIWQGRSNGDDHVY